MKKFSSLLVVLLLMLASFTAGVRFPRGDVNYDGQVSISDVIDLVNFLSNGHWPEDHEAPDGREWVDLGLPSGTLWATMNLGASAPEEYGDHFDQLGLGGIYWSSTLYRNNPDIAYGLYFESDDWGWEDYRRDIGRAVRPVLVYHY